MGESRTIRLERDAYQRFIEALDAPAVVPEKLAAQARRARPLKRIDRVRVERLREHHAIGDFSCGVKALNKWLRAHARENQRRDLSRTFVLVDDAEHVVGYYALTMGGVRKEALPARYGRGLPAYDIGMVPLDRLAISHDRQGQGLGRDLLIEAIKRAAEAGQHAAARFIAVDPIDQNARSFYGVFGFRAVEEDSGGKMCLRIDEALAALGRPNWKRLAAGAPSRRSA